MVSNKNMDTSEKINIVYFHIKLINTLLNVFWRNCRVESHLEKTEIRYEL